MGRKDIVTKNYMRVNEIFADAFNYLLYDGEPIIHSENLKEIDTTEIALISEKGQTQKKPKAIQRYRDVLKKAVMKQDGEMIYLLLGIENQTEVHYAMPVRNLIYDALQYGKQVNDISARHKRTNRKDTKIPVSEYLSGFYKEDKIIPVITLVIHFGTDPWDGPESLHEMMDVNDKRILNYIPDYRIHLIDPARLTVQKMEKFQTSLREVLGYIKYAKNKEKLKEYMADNPRMVMETMAAQVIKEITHTAIQIPEEEEKIDMCQAVDEMIKDGEINGFFKAYVDLVKGGILSVKEASIRTNLTEKEFIEKMGKLSEINPYLSKKGVH